MPDQSPRRVDGNHQSRAALAENLIQPLERAGRPVGQLVLILLEIIIGAENPPILTGNHPFEVFLILISVFLGKFGAKFDNLFLGAGSKGRKTSQNRE